MSERTSETWEVFQSATNDFGIVVMREGKPVFVVDPGNIRLDDAERSVRACNSHEALVEAGETFIKWIDACHKGLPSESLLNSAVSKHRAALKLAGAA